MYLRPFISSLLSSHLFTCLGMSELLLLDPTFNLDLAEEDDYYYLKLLRCTRACWINSSTFTFTFLQIEHHQNKTQCHTIEGYFNLTKVKGKKDAIIALQNTCKTMFQ
jgi:hypothetical protein